MSKTIYTDASFDYKHTDTTKENFVRGKIAISDDRVGRVEKVVIGKVEGLRQYINVLELTAIARAVEIASLEDEKPQELVVYTDSRVAMYWARNGKIKPSIATEAHNNALEYLRCARIQFGGTVAFEFVPRDDNPAGHLLQAELDAGKKPHDL